MVTGLEAEKITQLINGMSKEEKLVVVACLDDITLQGEMKRRELLNGCKNN